MAETSCLWVVTMRNIVGISLEELMGWGKEVVDWRSISPLPYDFHLKLPEESMTPFVHESKLFLAGGFIPHQPHDCALSSKFYQLFFDKDGEDNGRKKPLTTGKMSGEGPPSALPQSCIANSGGKVSLDGRKKSLALRISEAASDSIPPPPTLLPQSYIANIGGKVYLLVYDARKEFRMVKREEGFWVLGSGGKEWQALPGPPPMYLDDFGHSHEFFVLQDKLFFEAYNMRDGNYYLFTFDTQTNKWYQLDDNITKSFSFLEDEREILFPMVAPLSLPDINRNCTRVTLSWTWERLLGSQVRVKIYAMQLNNKDNSVFRYQSLDEVSEAIQPSSFLDDSTLLKFVELGSGLVCALVHGFPPEHNHGTTPVLCVLVFALSFIADQAAEGKEQRFLLADVRVNRVFTLANLRGSNFEEDLEHAFIFPSEGEEQHACPKGTTSPLGNNRS